MEVVAATSRCPLMGMSAFLIYVRYSAMVFYIRISVSIAYSVLSPESFLVLCSPLVRRCLA